MQAPETVCLHIGLHKTGTTYLQSILRANRKALRAQGIEFPGGSGEPSQAFAVLDLHGRRPRGADDERIAGQWEALVRCVNECGLPTALISEERLSISTLKQARKVVDAFPDSEVHAVVTARDLGRVLVSQWQEEIKNEKTWRWREYAAAIRGGDRARDPGRGFWMRQDLIKICQTWEVAVSVARLHIVTVPQSGPPDRLLQRFAAVVGLDPAKLSNEPARTNESVGVAGIEVIRRVNERLGGRLNQRQYDRVVKRTIIPMVAARTEPVRFSLPPEDFAWVTERAEGTIAALRARGYPVVGDLDDLQPVPRPSDRRPDDATDEEVRESALDVLAFLSEAHATSWWERKKPYVKIADAREGAASSVRAFGFGIQQWFARLADHNRVAASVISAVQRWRDRALNRALNKSKK
jgi:hypothetical protein